MGPVIAIIVVIGVIGLITLIVKLAQAAAERERQRKSALAAWAQQNGFAYSEQDPFDLDTRYSGFGSIGTGHDRYAFEVIHSTKPVDSFIFRYHYRTTETRTVTETDSNGQTHTRTETYEEDHWHAYLVIELQAGFPMLRIRPEHWGDKVAGLLGFDDINFESEQFSRRYFVKSADKQFAYAVIHPQMMEWLMDKKFAAQIERGMFVADLTGRTFDAAVCQAAWIDAAGFINQFPPFVWQDYGKRTRVELPMTMGYEVRSTGTGAGETATARSVPPPLPPTERGDV